VTYLASATGGPDGAYRYDPFGRWLAQTGSYAGANGMRFSSKPWLAHNGSNTEGLYSYGYRFYDPQTQRWLNRDPIGEPGFETRRGKRSSVVLGEPNRYEFIHNDPLNRIDPVGLWQWGWPPWGKKKDKKCKDCEKQDNPAKELFKTAADILAGEVGGKAGGIVRLLLLAADAKKDCGDMKGAANTCMDFALRQAADPGYPGADTDCQFCCQAILGSFPGLGGFDYYQCLNMCLNF
jgi:RHS repeat-associated protein